MPSFKIVCLLVLKKKILKVFAIYSHGGQLGHVTCDLNHSYKLSFSLPKNAPHAVWLSFAKRYQRRRSLNYGNIHVYCPGVGADLPLGSIYFQNHKYSVHLPISIKFFPSNDILTIFPIQMHGRPMLTLP